MEHGSPWDLDLYRRYSKIRCLWFIDSHGWFMVDNSIHLLWNTPMDGSHIFLIPSLTNHTKPCFLQIPQDHMVCTSSDLGLGPLFWLFRPLQTLSKNSSKRFFWRWLKSWGSMACHDDIGPSVGWYLFGARAYSTRKTMAHCGYCGWRVQKNDLRGATRVQFWRVYQISRFVCHSLECICAIAAQV